MRAKPPAPGYDTFISYSRAIKGELAVPPVCGGRACPAGRMLRLRSLVGVRMSAVTGKGERVAGTEGERLVGHVHRDRPFLEVQEFLRPCDVGLTVVPATRTPKPPHGPVHSRAPCRAG